MKKYLLIMLTLLLTLSLFSCNQGTIKYKCHEITIRLPEEFSNIDAEGYTMRFNSDNVSIAGLREDYAKYPDLKEKSIEDYSNDILKKNTERGMTRSEYFSDMASAEHSYVNTSDNITLKFFSVMKKTDEAFWIIQFSCAEDEYDTLKPQFIEWAKSIRY